MPQKQFVTCFVASTTKGEGGYVFTPLCLFVCLSVCCGYLKKLWTDLDEICWTGWCVTTKRLFDFGEDPNLDLDTIII